MADVLQLFLWTLLHVECHGLLSAACAGSARVS
jgi:hypothetical protein